MHSVREEMMSSLVTINRKHLLKCQRERVFRWVLCLTFVLITLVGIARVPPESSSLNLPPSKSSVQSTPKKKAISYHDPSSLLCQQETAPPELRPFSQIVNDWTLQTDGAHSTLRVVDFESLAPIQPRNLLIDGYEIGWAVGSDGVVEVDLSPGEHLVEVFAPGYRPMRARHEAVSPNSVINVFSLIPEQT